MSGIDRITEKILDQARLQAENKVAYSKEATEKAEASLEKRFDRTMEAEKKRAIDEGAESAKRVIANVKLEGRKKKLAARQDAVNLVFDSAVKKMAGLPEKEYVRFLANIAMPALGKGKNELILNTRDRDSVGIKIIEILGEKVPDMKVVVSEETVSSLGGLVVRNGDIQTNLTLESIIRLEREKLEADVVGLIFESE
ncbi:MAG: hypothetical protein KAH14_03185 [Clostridiales bacterium]|nr:hypothetical protein [Clostridiales bacterium]